MKGMAIRLAALTLTFIIGIIAPAFWKSKGVNPQLVAAPGQIRESGIEDEEYAVYSAILDGDDSEETDKGVKKADRLVVIRDKPSSPWINLIDEAEDKFYEGLKTSSPLLLAETVDDLRARSKESHLLTRRFDTKRRYVLVSEKEINDFFKHGIGGWESFYQKYPDARGLTTFSRVGFNHDKTQALVYVANSCGGLCGSGGTLLLTREKGVWVVKGMVGSVWIS